MSMGYSACQAWVISNGALKSLVSKELRALHKALEKRNIEFDMFCLENQQNDGDVEIDEPLYACYDDLQQAFKKKTGLDLQTEYHDSEQGSCYDGISGGFWIVDGMTQLTPAGKKLQGKVHEEHWCVYG